MLLSNQEQYKTTNTFTRSPSLAQAFVYLVSLFQILTAYIIIQNRLTSHMQTFRIVFIVVYGVLVCGKIVSSVIVSVIDPSDQLMVMCRGKRTAENQAQIAKTKQQVKNYLFCRQCVTFVKPESKHCKKCQRCVQYFDHHCIWLNNCIGSRNYKQFIWMLWFVQFQMTMFMIGGSVLWAEKKYTGDMGILGIEERYHVYEMALVWVMMFVVGVFWILNFNLIILHMYLIKIGKTTYEWLFPTEVASRKMMATRIVSSRQTVSNDEGIVGNINPFQGNNEVRDHSSITVSNQVEDRQGQTMGIGQRNLTLDQIPEISRNNNKLPSGRQESSSSSHKPPNPHKNSLPTPKNVAYATQLKQKTQQIPPPQDQQQQANPNTLSIFGNSLKMRNMFNRNRNKIFPYIEQDDINSIEDKNIKKGPVDFNLTEENLNINNQYQQGNYREEVSYPIDQGYIAGSSDQDQENASNNIKTETQPGSEGISQRNYNLTKDQQISRAQMDRNLFNSVKIMRKQPQYNETINQHRLKQSHHSKIPKKDTQKPPRKMNNRTRSLQSILSMVDISQVTQPIKIKQMESTVNQKKQ